MPAERNDGHRLDGEPSILPLESPESSPSLTDTLRRRKWVVLGCVGAGAAIGLIQAAGGIPIYQASSKVLLLPQGRYPVLRDPAVADQGNRDIVRTQMEVLCSPEVVTRAIERGGLAELDGMRGTGPKAALADELVRRLATHGEEGSDTFTVGFQSPNPQTCAQVVNAVVDAYIGFVEETEAQTFAKGLKILEDQKEREKAQLRQKEQQLAALEKQVGAFVAGVPGQNAVVGSVTTLRDMLVQARLRELQAKTRYEMIKKAVESDETVDVYALASALEGTRGELAVGASGVPGESEGAWSRAARVLALRLEITRLSRELGPNHPRIQALEDQLKVLGAAVPNVPQARFDVLDPHPRLAGKVARAATVKRMVETFAQQYQICRAVREKLEADYQERRTEAASASSDQTNLRLLDSEIKLDKKYFEAVVEQMKALNLFSQVGSLAVRVLERAKPPSAPISAGSGRTVAMSLLLGLMGGFGLAMFLDRSDRSFRSPDDVKRALQLPVLGNVPTFEAKQGEAEAEAPSIVVHNRPGSIEAEAFRALRTVMGYAAGHRGLRSFLITSPNPHDGKTTVACNLATTIASLGRRVLVVDGDLRHRQIHRIFGCDNSRGLTHYLSTGDEHWRSYVLKTVVPNLHVLPAGRRPSNPAELLGSARFRDLVPALEEAYDDVIIDSPPTLLVTDASVISGSVDATVLIVKISKNERSSAVAGKEALAAVNANLLGVILNDVSSKSRYGYSYYHRYQYHYGRGYRYYSDKQVMSA